MIRRPPRSTPLYSSAASDVYKRQGARGVTQECRAPWLIERRPVGDAILELLDGASGVFDEPVDDRTVWPASGVFERLWQVPVVQRHQGLDAVLLELVENA